MLALLFLRRIDKQSLFRIVVTVFAIILSTIILFFCLSLGQAINSSRNRQGELYILDSYRGRNDENIKPCIDCIAVNSRILSSSPYPQVKEYAIKRYSNRAPFILGLTRVPDKTEVFVSSGLKKLIEENSSIRAKYQKYQLVEHQIDESKLPYMNSAIAIVALPDATFSKLAKSGATFLSEESFRVYHFDRNSTEAKIINTFMLLCGLGLIFPLLVLIISATRIGMLQRQHRYAALSLLGTSKYQINQINFVETALVTSVGVSIGISIFYSIKDFLAYQFSINGNLLHPADFSLPFYYCFGVITLIFFLVLSVNWWAMRKVKTSPLGVVKNQKIYRRPSILSIIPTLISFSLLFLANNIDKKPDSTGIVMVMLLSAFVFAMIGVVTIGPFTTYIFGKIINFIARRPSLIIATRRICIHAKTIFQGISGIVLALFVGSFFIASLATFRSLFLSIYKIEEIKDNFSIMDAQFKKPGIKFIDINSISDLNFISSSPSLKRLGYEIFLEQSATVKQEDNKEVFGTMYSCDELEKFTYFTCDKTYRYNKDYRVLLYLYPNSEAKPSLSYVPLSKIKKIQRTNAIYYFSDINARDRAVEIVSNLTLEHFRSTGEDFYSFSWPKTSAEKELASLDKSFSDLVALVYMGTSATIIIGGFSLAVSTIGSFFERKKSFINLRLMGVKKQTLYLVVFVETISAVVVATIISVLVGTFFSWYSIKSIGQNNLKNLDISNYFSWPEPTYFLIVIASVFVSFLIISSILPILNSITNPKDNRTE